MLGSFGIQELLVVMAILLLIFGPKQLPRVGRALGETIREARGVGRELTKGHDDGGEAD